MDEEERMLGVMIECENPDQEARELEEIYTHKMENQKEFLFGDELGFVEDEKPCRKKDLIEIFNQILTPLILNYQNLYNKYL